MNRKLVLILSLLLVGGVLLFTGCSSTTSKGGNKILRSNNGSEPGSLDPALAQGTHESWVLENVFEGFMTFDEKGELVKGMAKDYKISDDGLIYTFTIRDDAKWSNGEPVKAEDFEFAWKRALDPEMAADYAYQLYYIKGGEAFNSGETTADQVAIKP